MKAEPLSSSFTALILKVAGLLLILGVLVDFVVLAVPPNFLDSRWLVNLISEWVGRGTIPLLGLALILFGVWIGRQAATNRRNPAQGWLLWSLILSGLLGLVFLLIAPVYFRSNQLASAAETRLINEQAVDAEEQLNVELELRRSQVSSILSNQELVDQLQRELQTASQGSEQEQAFSAEIQETLQQIQDDPGALDQRIETARQEGLQRIAAEQQQAIEETTQTLRLSRIRITLNSLVLAIGYGLIAWTGMTLAGSERPKAKKKKARR